MTRQDIYTMLNNIAPTYYHHAPIGTSLPFITFLTDHDNNFGADDKVYKQVTGATITLYMGADDLSLEDQVNSALDEHDIYWVSSTDYDSLQEVYTTIYEMEVI